MSWSSIVGSAIGAAGNAYSATAAADAAADTRRAADRNAERERQRALTATSKTTWLVMGVGGAVTVILVTIFLIMRKK